MDYELGNIYRWVLINKVGVKEVKDYLSFYKGNAFYSGNRYSQFAVQLGGRFYTFQLK